MIIKVCIISSIILLAIWFISIYNKLIYSRIKVREAFSTMDICLKKRFDLIPNLVEIVKEYMGYENETLSKITGLRSNIVDTPKEKIENEKEISNNISTLLMSVESYPELKADNKFLELQNQLKSIENDIEKARRYYNGAVTYLNTLINMIPSNIIATICKIEEEPFFEIDENSQRGSIQLNL